MKFFYQTMLVLSSVFLFSCHQISDRKLRCYENPLKTTDSTELYIADPFIYKAGGLYYLTGTTALPEGEGFAYYISSDLIRCGSIKVFCIVNQRITSAVMAFGLQR